MGFVFDLNNKSTLESLDSWLNEFLTNLDTGTKQGSGEVAFMLIGNKCDMMKESMTIVDTEI